MTILSSNTVGYLNNNETVAGLNLLAPGFVDVGFTSTKLAGLKVSNAQGGEVGTGTCGIDLIDQNGNTLTHYSWASQGRGANKTWGWELAGTRVDSFALWLSLRPPTSSTFRAKIPTSMYLGRCPRL